MTLVGGPHLYLTSLCTHRTALGAGLELVPFDLGENDCAVPTPKSNSRPEVVAIMTGPMAA